MGHSILDDLGQEVTGIVSPVTICMFLTVCLVRVLNPDGTSNPSAVAIAQIYHQEKESDSTSVKLEGALLNALIFVVIVGVMTFVLFLLFKYGCESCIWGYMAFAAFNILFLVLGIVAIQLVQLQPLPIDLVSFLFVLWNFSVVGTATMFLWPAPVVMKQGYMIVVGIVMAFLFTGIPEWTTWILLLAMAVYDIVAVLMPNGPLKGNGGRWGDRRRQADSHSAQARVSRLPVSTVMMAQGGNSREAAMDREEIELTDSSQDTPTLRSHASSNNALAGGEVANTEEIQERSVAAAGIGFMEADRTVLRRNEGPEGFHEDVREAQDEALLARGGLSDEAAVQRQPAPRQRPGDRGVAQQQPAAEEWDDDLGLPDGIKLGLGDFIFYSVLVGRAAMYDWLTVFACYLAIIAGLGATLICLALYQAALPALPISITLGVVFYFLARWVLEPFLLPMSLHLLYF